jgi:hypothetical protein
MSYVIRQGMRMLVMYGWPAFASQDADKCTLQQDRPIIRLGGETMTTDEDGREAFYLFSLSYKPMVFDTQESAQYVIDRFKLPDAKPERWRE